MRDKIVGIYLITNLVNGKIYIGQSADIQARWWSHKGKSQKRTYLSSAIEKHGLENFSFEILIKCPIESLDFFEAAFITSYNACDRKIGYNLIPGGKGGRGHHMSDEQKKKISEANRNPSLETRAKLSAVARRNASESARRLAEGNRNRVWTEEARAKKSASMKASMSPERRAAIGLQHKGQIVSEETRVKLRAAAARRLAKKEALMNQSLNLEFANDILLCIDDPTFPVQT